MLEYKAERYGRSFGKIGRFEPADRAMLGLRCQQRELAAERLAQSTCARCGRSIDRDLIAAKHILALGRRERLNACGDGVRPPLAVAVVGETGTHRGAA